MSDKPPEKYEKVQSRIEKTINPYVTIKIPMPEGVDREAFLKLETDAAFLDYVKKEVKERLEKK
jgi:hypothetical protein